MNTYKVLGYNPFRDTWEDLGTIEAATVHGANLKAHKLWNKDNAWVEFGIFAVGA